LQYVHAPLCDCKLCPIIEKSPSHISQSRSLSRLLTGHQRVYFGAVKDLCAPSRFMSSGGNRWLTWHQRIDFGRVNVVCIFSSRIMCRGGSCGLGLKTRRAGAMAHLAGALAGLSSTGARRLVGAWNSLDITFGAICTITGSWSTWTWSRIRPTLTSRFVTRSSGSSFCTTSFLLLDLSETPSLIMNILYLPRGLSVKVDELLTGGRPCCLLVV